MSLNTTPRNWTPGEVVSAAELNTEVRDALTGVQAAWDTYTPTWTNLTVGNGTVIARYLQIGKTVHVRISLTGGTTSSASGAVSVSLPVVASGLGAQAVLVKHWTTAANLTGWADIQAAGPSAAPLWTFQGGASGAMAAVSTFGNNQVLIIQGTYEAA